MSRAISRTMTRHNPHAKAEEKHTQVGKKKNLLSIQCSLCVAIGWLNFTPDSLGPGPWAQPLLSPPLSLTLLYFFTIYMSNSVATILLRLHFSAGCMAKHFPYWSKKILTIQASCFPATPHTEHIFLLVAKPFLPWIFQPSFVAVSSKSSPPEKS